MNSNTYSHNNICGKNHIYLSIFYFIVSCVGLWLNEIERKFINTLSLWLTEFKSVEEQIFCKAYDKMKVSTP